MYRSAQSFGGEYQYINTTGRNDIDYAKVSAYEGNLYFLAAAVDELVLADDEAGESPVTMTAIRKPAGRGTTLY